ncbi:MAG: argininosuccinate synthase, partial [Planctomycetes bacterium]|nr:argininosuccinate synthase [Planctomycetota bacterium]
YVEIEFEQGVPVAVDGETMSGKTLIEKLNRIAGEHGVGRIDHVENRLVGIKSREIYEAPAAIVLHKAHRALESIALTRPALRFKESVSQQYADIVYDGLWFSAFHQDLLAYVLSSQRAVSGTVRMRLYRGQATKVGLKSPFSLYSKALATYDEGDQFAHDAAVGFIELHGLPTRVQARTQMSALSPEEVRARIMPPEIEPK